MFQWVCIVCTFLLCGTGQSPVPLCLQTLNLLHWSRQPPGLCSLQEKTENIENITSPFFNFYHKTDRIFIKSYTQAYFLTSRNLPEENEKHFQWWFSISCPWIRKIYRFVCLQAHKILYHWFAWLNVTKNWNDTIWTVPKKHSEREILPKCW